MALRSEDIAMAHRDDVCSFYAIINLFKRRGLRPPTFEELVELYFALDPKCTCRERQLYGGLINHETHALIVESDFHGLVVAGAVPRGVPPEVVLKPFLNMGYHFIIGYAWKHPDDGQVILHAVVVEGYTEEGYQVIDSAGGYSEDSLIELEPTPTPEEHQERKRWKEIHPHGARRILPFVPLRTHGNPLGIDPYFIMAFPSTTEDISPEFAGFVR